MPGGDLFALEPTDDPTRWRAPVAPRMLTHAGAVHGGTAFALAIETMETVVERPLVWASAQFIRHAGPDATLAIDVSVELAGHNTTQARARVHADGVEVLAAWGAFGSRPFDSDGVWATPPSLPEAELCEADLLPSVGDGRLVDFLEVRLAAGRTRAELDGTPGTGHWSAWCRRTGHTRHRGHTGQTGHTGEYSAADLAVFGDLVMFSLSDTLGRACTGNSLDNSLRMVGRDATEWILLDVTVDAVAGGFAHTHARLWSERGALLAIAQQTLVVRDAGADGRSQRRARRIVG